MQGSLGDNRPFPAAEETPRARWAASAMKKLSAARLLGPGPPEPQPPSRDWAMTAPAHLPEFLPQQTEKQSESSPQAPVINWVPGWICAKETIETGRRKDRQIDGFEVDR